MAVENGVIEIESDKRIALLIAILALFLAIFETGAKSAQTEAISQNVEATNLWAFYQARTVRQTIVRTAADAAELQRAATADPAVRAAIEAQQKAWRDQANGWESNKAGDGRKELTEKARATEESRERFMAQYHFYEYAAALLQVAIVIASASIITSIPPLALLSILLALGGVALGGIGFFAPQIVHM